MPNDQKKTINMYEAIGTHDSSIESVFAKWMIIKKMKWRVCTINIPHPERMSNF